GGAPMRVEDIRSRLITLSNRDQEFDHLRMERNDPGLRGALGGTGLMTLEDDLGVFDLNVRPAEPGRLASPGPRQADETEQLDESVSRMDRLLRLRSADLRRDDKPIELVIGHRPAGLAGPVRDAAKRVCWDQSLLGGPIEWPLDDGNDVGLRPGAR